MEKSEVTVSVMVTTYNQDLYIGQALEGILSQKVTFPYEIIIGDDCSTDQTGKIIEQYQLKYPNIIRAVRYRRNVGEKKNTSRLLKLCRGKYIAVCEGDDYWIDVTKLKSQVDFLEKNPQYIGTAHNVLCVDAKGKRLGKRKIDFPYQEQHVYGKKNALRYEELGQMSSYVYRNIWLDATAHEFRLFEQCNANSDVKLNATLGLMGDIYYFDNIWSCRRRICQGEGWTAWITNNNTWDYAYASCVNVKQYVRARFHEDMEVDSVLLKMWCEAVKVFIHTPTQINFQVLQRIWRIKSNGNSQVNMGCAIIRIWLMEKMGNKGCFTYERIYQNIKKYGYYSPVVYWISNNKKCIYIQNPKVACSSIKASIYGLDNVQDYEDIHNILLNKGHKLKKEQRLEKDFPNIFKFSFVRNPYERLVSCYVNKFITDKQEGKNNYFRDYFIQSIRWVKKFDEFVYRIFLIPDKLSDWHFSSQHCFTHNRDGSMRVNYIGKYDNLQRDFDRLASRYQFPQLNWYNKSPKYDWRDFYTLRTAVLVYIRYHKDFKLYGYQESFSNLLKYIIIKKRRKM